MRKITFLFLLTFLFACASTTPKPDETKEDLTGWGKFKRATPQTDGGFSATIWKVPIFGIGWWGDVLGWSSYGIPSMVVYNYNYQARPPALAPGTPPTPPSQQETEMGKNILPAPEVPAATYPTVYESIFNDPTLVVFKNDSFRKARIEIDGKSQISLEPYGTTADLHLNFGPHRIKITIEKNTYFGTKEMVYYRDIYINLYNRRSQIFRISDYYSGYGSYHY